MYCRRYSPERTFQSITSDFSRWLDAPTIPCARRGGKKTAPPPATKVAGY